MTDNNAVVIPATVLVKGVEGLGKIIDKNVVGRYTYYVIQVA